MVTSTRQTAEDRRESILRIAQQEFAARGLHGASTEDIARRAGISQPYVFRLFGTKKELFIAAGERCMSETLDTFKSAAEGLTGERALEAIGRSYVEMLADRIRLLAQMQAYASCDDPDVCAVVRRGYGELVQFVERVSGADPVRVARFFAKGMLLNVVASMNLLDAPEHWARRLVEGCRADA